MVLSEWAFSGEALQLGYKCSFKIKKKNKFPFSLFLKKCEAVILSFTIYSIPEVLYLLLCTELARAGEQSWFVCVVFSMCFI